jgi:CheY-like chemotaxis protein
MTNKEILLVEDDYLDIINVQRAFKKLNVNHQLHTAHNGIDALSILRGEKGPKVTPDLILLDVNMPKMTGFEFLKILRDDRDLRNIKVFVLTTSAEDYDKDKARSLGVSGYIIKPVNFDDYENRSSSMDNFNLMLELLK